MKIEDLTRQALASFAPPPDLTISEWADQFRYLSPEASAEPGRWNTDRAPYQRGIMDAISHHETETVVLMTSAQIGKTAILENVVGYYVSQDPSPTLLLQPTLEMAATFSKDRLAPMLRDTPSLRGLVKDARARDSGNTQLHKQFPGGHITMTGANSPANLASRPIRVVLCDEVDRYPESAGTEGDPVALARKRSATFWNRKIVLTSTPTIKGLSRIEQAYLASDQRRYWVPCPDCGEHQVLTWANVRWDEDQPETAHYVCEHCGSCIDEQHKLPMLQRGEWRASAPFKGAAGFHINELYSPWRRWSEIAADFLEAKQGGSEMLKAWVNTSLGETWEDQGDAVEAGRLVSRLEQYSLESIPANLVTAGVDVQKDRLEASFVAWGTGEEAWLVDHIIIAGDTTQPDPWDELAALFNEIRPRAVAIDSGFNTSAVYAFVQKFRFCRAIKGMPGMNRPFIEDDRRRAQRLRRNGRRGVTVEPIGVDGGKLVIHSRLRLSAAGPGFIHFPDEPGFDDEYFAQLAAEKLVTKYRFGRPYQEWVQQRPRNEALDCLVYALAALRLFGLQPRSQEKAAAAQETKKTFEELLAELKERNKQKATVDNLRISRSKMHGFQRL